MTHEMEIRKFTDRGIDRFSEYLAALNVGSTVSPPYDLLTDPQTSTPALADIAIERRIFHTRLDAARYLDDILADTDRDAVQDDIHLWGWLSLFYFDQVCPVDPRNRRRPGRSYRHILEPGYPYGHRHLIHGAFLVYTAYGWGEELSRLLLSTPLHTESMFHHEIAGRQNLITNRGVMEAVHRLYFDESAGKPRRGALMKDMPGTLYRFIDVIQQLDLTYDLYSMNGEEILGLLPPEFDRWRP